MLRDLPRQLKAHAPFTAFGTLTAIAIMAGIICAHVPRSVLSTLFWTLHPTHVLLSALVTAAMYPLHSPGRLGVTVLISYVGSVGIATLSDSIIPYFGECLFGLPNKGVHFGFIEKWWLVNPMAVA
jgi:hypothetical protein